MNVTMEWVGSTLPARVELPTMPAFISEWAALIPLIVHLASPKGDHNLIGELALSGRLTLSLLPKLGHFNGISRLVSGIPGFLDRASGKSNLSSRIWDVDWGSSFPCANGAARDGLTRYALRNVRQFIEIEGQMTDFDPVTDSSDKASGNVRVESVTNEQAPSKHLRRYQLLHVIEIHKGNPVPTTQAEKWLYLTLDFIGISTFLLLTFILALVGAYGTAVTLLLCLTTQVACRYLPTNRPPGYLENVEKHENACMLSATHSNASEWYLYIGHRASIDWLLNKSMITVRTEDSGYWATGFRMAHYIQLLAMTFVAGNKGWDGVFLVCMLVINAVFKTLWEYPAHWAALQWISSAGLTITAHRFKVTGRTPMMGAIQLLSDAQKPHKDGFVHGNVAWMNEILHPLARRHVWAKSLANTARRRSGKPIADAEDQETNLSDSDSAWVEKNLRWAQETYTCINNTLKTPINFVQALTLDDEASGV